MENNNDKKRFDPVYSNRVKAGKRRTYFFDVRKTKGDDYFISMTESTRRYDGNGYERHKIFLYKEDFNKFIENLEDTINYVKENLIPDFDYDAYANDFEEDDKDENDNNSSGEITSEKDMEW